jgi:transcriptional regulator with XRE-family HTH domain
LDLPEDDVTADLGARLRAARLQRGMTLRSVAQALGVSASLISQVETGKTQPSVSTLYALVNHLGVSMDELVGVVAQRDVQHAPPDAEPAMLPAVQRGADNPVLEMENGVRWERLAAGGEGPVDPLLVSYEPGACSSIEGRLMRHAGVEYALVLEGELTLQLDFDTHVLGPGDSLHFDSVRPHMYTNNGDVVARGVWFVVGRRQQNLSLPTAPSGAARVPVLGSAVDVLQAMDDLHG